MSLIELFDMGKYTFHVWTCWGLSISTMLIIVILGKRKNANIKKELARQIRRDAKIASEG